MRIHGWPEEPFAFEVPTSEGRIRVIAPSYLPPEEAAHVGQTIATVLALATAPLMATSMAPSDSEHAATRFEDDAQHRLERAPGQGS